MITNRGMLKWQPFNELVSSGKMINEVLSEKNKIKMPVLSDDQIQELQNKIIISFNNQTNIKIKYYRDGRFYLMEGKVTNIDGNRQRITINANFFVFFSQIIEIY